MAWGHSCRPTPTALRTVYAAEGKVQTLLEACAVRCAQEFRNISQGLLLQHSRFFRL